MLFDENDPQLGEIAKLEKELLDRKKKLVELKQKLPEQEVKNYSFKTWDGGTISLSDLFGDKSELILVHNMGKRCPYCTLWADGYNGLTAHLENRAAFVVTSPDDPATQQKFAESRGWRFKMYSVHESSFPKDMRFQGDKDDYWPGVSTFRKDASGKIYRKAWAYFGPGDDFCAVWPMLDLLPSGPNDWEPKYKY
jgi:predicted dithiol-disulfide oxidoreductase (DUF899 family)